MLYNYSKCTPVIKLAWFGRTGHQNAVIKIKVCGTDTTASLSPAKYFTWFSQALGQFCFFSIFVWKDSSGAVWRPDREGGGLFRRHRPPPHPLISLFSLRVEFPVWVPRPQEAAREASQVVQDFLLHPIHMEVRGKVLCSKRDLAKRLNIFKSIYTCS